MCNKTIKHLSWDSDFFNKKIGRIDCDDLHSLNKTFRLAKQENYNLIYVFCKEDFFIDEIFLEKNNGKLVDRKVLYVKNISEVSYLPSNVEFYEENELTIELENLAYESGKYSRFKLDKNFAEDDFYRMYKMWIENSVKNQIADYVFVVKENNTIKGMATLKIADKIGNIGLIAVAPDTQGKGYGKALIQICENKLIEKGVSILEVPTQLDNIQTCRFYEKCGFKIKEITNIYHFWL
jgi:dTDP-4-amino-4,6-dideoxy-D-galactose acyltransferase